MSTKLIDWMDGIKYNCLQGDINIEVENICYDTRKAVPNCVFVCIPGAKVDGHQYVEAAIAQGAVAIIVEQKVIVPDSICVIQVEDAREALALMSAAYFDYPAKKLVTIGITGTKGKTTVSYMVKAILENAGYHPGLMGTIETIIGEKTVPANNTTPESYEVQRAFKEMVDAGLDCVVMEVSSQGLKLKRVAGIVFDYGVFTNLSADHIGPHEHTDLEDYIFCKSLLFQQCKKGIFNQDDKYFEQVMKGHTCELETYGFSENADLRACDVQLWREPGHLGVSFQTEGVMNLQAKINLPGRFSVYNALVALSICRHFKVSEKDMLEAFNDIKVRGRVEIVPFSPNYTLLIDYAHNEMSLNSILTTLREYRPKRLICLFGCGGNRSRDRRFMMGEVSASLADLTVITSDNPRDEEPQSIIDDILVGVNRIKDTGYVTIIDRIEAIRYCIEQALPGDIIVLAGKGHEDYQEIKGVKHAMDDRKIIEDIAKGK